MGLCLSICARNDEYDEFHNQNQDRRHLLSEEDDYLDEEALAAKRKDELDRIVNETVSGFVDISSFISVQKSVPIIEDVNEVNKEKFHFGNGMTNHYKLSDDEADQLYINLTSENISSTLKDNLKSCSREIRQMVNASLGKIELASINGKVIGKL